MNLCDDHTGLTDQGLGCTCGSDSVDACTPLSPGDSSIEKLEAARTELLDISLRNPLLNYRPLKSRGVEVIDEIPSAVFDILVNKARSMSFLSRREDNGRASLDLTVTSAEDLGSDLGQPDEDERGADGLAPRHTDNRLQTNESTGQLQSRLLKSYYSANTLLQEQGVNTLFITLGMVEWYESDASDITRRAPLILVPVEITRTDVRGRFYVSHTFEELGANLSFMEKVRNDFGIEIPGLPDDEDLDVDAYFADVAGRIKDMDRWTVDRMSVVLGFFSFGKFLMYRDLDPDTWPEGTGYGPKESPIIRALFGGGFTESEPKIEEEDHLDDHLRPEDVHHVVDADSSQALAIFDVNQGRNLVIQGPPGTGKSQTIMNIIAEAIGMRRTVLFVSEKMAALEVVKHRLDGIGLGVACLELHSHKTKKLSVLDELKKTLGLGPPTAEGMGDDFSGLSQVRSRLNAYAEAVNSTIGDTGATPFRAYGELIRIRDEEQQGPMLPRVDIPGIESWSAADFESKLNTVSEFQTRLGRVGVPENHVFWGTGLRRLLPNGQAFLREGIDATSGSLDRLILYMHNLAELLGLSPPEDVVQAEALLHGAAHSARAPDIRGVDLSAFGQHPQREVMKRLVETGKSWVDLHARYDKLLEPGAWDADVSRPRHILSTTGLKLQGCVKPKFHNSPHNPSMPQETIAATADSLEELMELTQKLGDALGLDPPQDRTQTSLLMPLAEHAATAPDIGGVRLPALKRHTVREAMKSLAETGGLWASLHDKYDDILDPSAWNAEVREIRHVLSTVGRRFWKFLSPKYRRARGRLANLCLTALPESVDKQIEIVDAILQEQEGRRTFERMSSTAVAVLGPRWLGPESDWHAIGEVVEWALLLFRDIDSGLVAPHAVDSLRDDIENVRIRSLLDQLRATSATCGERLDALCNAVEFDFEGGSAGLLASSYVEQRDGLAEFSGENLEVGQAIASLSNLSRTELPAGVERQIEMADAILEEQGHRRTFEMLSPTAVSVLGQKWDGAGSDWGAVERIVGWLLALFRDVDNGLIELEAIGSLRNDIDAAEVEGPLSKARAALDSHTELLGSLQSFLKLDGAKRFKAPADIGSTGKGGPRPEGLVELSFEDQADLLASWSSGIDGIHDLVGFNKAAHEAEREGLESIVKLGAEWSEAAHLLRSVLERAWYEHVLSRALDERPAIGSFAGNIHEQLIGQFRSMDELALDQNRARVAHSHWSELPRHNAGGQLRILRRQFELKRRHLPIRRLMSLAGNAIQAIKPVFMMSPMSIAMYLPPGAINFDLIVFDEASQVRPIDALGAVMRSDQSVVVGDSKQLPPTRFFDAVTQLDDDEDDVPVGDMESILGMFRAEGAPDRMLRWHYRSRHESLIAVSNREFYDNGLVVFPSPDSSREDIGLKYHHLPDTSYDRGRSRTNRKEAATVAMHVMEHARRSPEYTLGVAAFSSAQREAILDELERLRRMDASCESFFNGHPEEPFFVKNLENVQGDERDVMFISIGYGRDASGQIAMNFGPLTVEGGERRLNVLITRARRRCEVFTNMQAADIDLNRTSSRGVRALKTFLAYAETGVLEDAVGESGREVDSPFQHAVAARLRSHGYDIHEELSTGGKFVDIAVVDPKHPGKYIIGIECDGASYHSSRSARDRDRIREQHLRNLGWRLHRIWSTDWFHNPERELNRTVEAIEQAKDAAPATHQGQKRRIPEIERDGEEEKTVDLAAQRYEIARPQVDTHPYELHEAPGYLFFAPITEIVRTEGPVHISDVHRRIAEAVGVARIGNRIKQNLNWAIDNAVRQGVVVRKGDFLLDTEMKKPAVRDRREIQGKHIEMVSPEEIAEALKAVVKQSYGINRPEAMTETARLLGFRNVTKNTRTRIQSVMESLIETGGLLAVEAQVFIANEP